MKNPQKNPEKGRFDPVTGVFGLSRENSQKVIKKYLYGVNCQKTYYFRRQTSNSQNWRKISKNG